MVTVELVSVQRSFQGALVILNPSVVFKLNLLLQESCLQTQGQKYLIKSEDYVILIPILLMKNCVMNYPNVVTKY